MKVLVVFAHPKPEGSFHHAVLEEFTQGLTDGGHTHEVVDLYRLGFDPVFKVEDYVFLADETIPADVLEQMGWREAYLAGAAAGPLGFLKRRIAERASSVSTDPVCISRRRWESTSLAEA